MADIEEKKKRRSTLPQKLNQLSAAWFWLTITGVFYYGLGYILPELYEGYSDTFFLCHHLLCYFMFTQMLANWLCVKFIPSKFNPNEYLDYLSDHSQEIANGGYEINLNHLKERRDDGTYSISSNNLKPLNGTSQRPNLTGTMYVVEVEGAENYAKKVIYPYWSWKPCVICQIHRPPRTHHCNICNTCVMKRDHHCFFTGSCVGLNNQRHFVVFNFWASMATLYCLFHSAGYLFMFYLPRNTYFDLFLPFALVRWVLGYLSTTDTIMAVLLYSLVWFWLTTTGFTVEQLRIIGKGKTSFEEDTDIKVTSLGTSKEHFLGVFGEHWLANFLFPLHRVFPHTENGVTWPHIKT